MLSDPYLVAAHRITSRALLVVLAPCPAGASVAADRKTTGKIIPGRDTGKAATSDKQ